MRREGVACRGTGRGERGIGKAEVGAWWREPDRRKQPDLSIFRGLLFLRFGRLGV